MEEKAGRIISDKNRGIITKAVSAMADASTALATLLEATQPKPKASEAEDALTPDEEVEKKDFITFIEDVVDTISVDEKDISERVNAEVEKLLNGKTQDIVRSTILAMRGKV